MLIVAGEIRMQPGTRDQFFDAVGPLVAATLKEHGCRTYAFTPDPGDPDLIRLFELWDDAAALRAHAGSAHIADWKTVRAALPIAASDIRKYTISDVGPL